MAITILMIVSVTLYRFVDTTLRAAAFSQKSGQEDAAFNGLRRLVASQLAALPANQDSTLVGMTVTSHGARRDAMQLVCPAGNAVLTPDAHGFYQITLGVREQGRGSGHFALGLEREPWTDDNDEDAAPAPAGNNAAGASRLQTTDLRPGRSRVQMPSDWVKLMDNVNALEVTYFDARLNGWVDRWTDPKALPNLVRVRLGTTDRAEPYEIVERVPGGGVQRVALPPVTAGFNPALQPNGANGLPANVPGRPNFTPPPAPPNMANPPTLPNFSSPPAVPAPFKPAPIPGNTNTAFGTQH